MGNKRIIKCYLASLFLFCQLLVLSSCAVVSTPVKNENEIGFFPESYSLNGKWGFSPGFKGMKELGDNSWREVSVPTNWYLDGHDIEAAWYRKTFYLPEEFLDKKITLRFSGVDYITEAWLNNQYLGRHEGYFQSFEFDLKEPISNKENELLVRVLSPLERPENYSLHKKLVKGIFSHHDTRPGNAWSPRGQEGNTGGIWSNVDLVITKDVRLEASPVEIERIRDNKWKVSSLVQYKGDLPRGSKVSWEMTAINSDDVRKWADTQRITKAGKEISFSIESPHLWWPAGYGKQNLYQLKIQLTNKGDILDQRTIPLGIRDVSIDKDKIWSINSKRILLKGTNYIGTQWLSEMTEDHYRKDIQLMLDAHVNVVRVHAHITDKIFYDLCDEMGLMVWQDYPLQWGYSDDAGTHETILRQLDDMFEQFYNHPSIIQWSLHNEPPWDSPWMKYKYTDYNPTQNKDLDLKLYRKALSLEKHRPVHMLSAGQEHPWLGWYSGNWLDYTKPAKTPWISEFGAQAMPNRDTVETIFPKGKRWPDTDQEWELWDYHNFQKRENFEIAKIEKGNNLDELIRNSQEYQSKLIQLAGESYRRQAYAPIGALFQFMFVENWPSINWGVVDYLRKPKPGYYAMKTAYQPVLPSLEWKSVTYKEGARPAIGVWAVNDSWENYRRATYSVSLHREGKLIDRRKWQIDITADSRKLFSQYRPPSGLQRGKYILVAEIINSERKLLGKTEYNFTVNKNKEG